MSPLFLAILFSRYFMRSFHDKLSSNKAPRNLIVLALSISWMFVFNVGRWERILYFLRNLWNNENLVFPTFSDSLFAVNHTLILINCSLTLPYVDLNQLVINSYNDVIMLPRSKKYCLRTLLEQEHLKN